MKAIAQRVIKHIKAHPAFRKIFFSFYFRLIFLDLKKNQFLLVLWLLLFGIITNNVAPRYGLGYIFLGPEYMDKLSFLSYFINGFAVGGFIMAYNMASYVKNAFRFPFLATLKNPFTKYCLNNFFIPSVFIVLYSYEIFHFLKTEEFMSTENIFIMLSGFYVGIFTFIFFLLTYFFKANKNITKLYGLQTSEISDKSEKISSSKNGERNPYLIKESRDWYVETYLVHPLKLRRVRSVRHYKKEILNSVLTQNHRSVFYFQMLSILSLIGFGMVSNISVFVVPTSSSIILLFTVLIMIFSSFYAWFRGWTTVIFILFLLVLNYVHKVNFLTNENRAYGLKYNTTPAPYNYQNLDQMDKDEANYDNDINTTISILNKWKQKNFNPLDSTKKPKLVLINTSGGGLRSSLWTVYALQYIDGLLGGKLMNQTQLITGSSGGMVGAAYLRELYLLKQENKIENYHSKKYLTNISKDILNPIAFTIATNEWIFPFKTFKIDDQSYSQDRGYAFEKTLNENVEMVFNKRLDDYQEPEANAKIPMMVFSSSIVNDGRKLLISPQGISYLTQNSRTQHVNYTAQIDGIEYSRLFKEQAAGKTLFTSVLRMSATFPYIMPVVSLPSEPRIEMIDAGLRDNYGLETSLLFLETFNDWIAENTSGVVIIQIRDRQKIEPIEENPSQTLMQTLTRPMGSFYGNLFSVQDYNQNQKIQFVDKWCKSKVDIVNLRLKNDNNGRISLSWHLTTREKNQVLQSMDLPENQTSVLKLIDLLK